MKTMLVIDDTVMLRFEQEAARQDRTIPELDSSPRADECLACEPTMTG